MAKLKQFWKEKKLVNFWFECEECGLSGNGLACQHFKDAEIEDIELQNGCSKCGRVRRLKPRGKYIGLCKSCYSQVMNAKNPKQKEHQKEWQKNNLAYFRKYFKTYYPKNREKWGVKDGSRKNKRRSN